MPKRSNRFQKLVTFIAEQVAPLGATVEESAELIEKGLASPTPREVDVLIEADGGMAPIRIALECRDRSRKDDISWIDDLIGKYRNLDVNQIIAVSSSGFSESAKEKADMNGIVTMSLEEASETDWPEKFARLGVALVRQNFDIVALSFTTHPPLESKITPDAKIRSAGSEPLKDGDEENAVDIQTFLADVNPVVVSQVKEYVSANALAIYKTLADLNKDAIVERTIPVTGLFLEVGDADGYEIQEMKYTILVRTHYSTVDVKRHLLSDKAMVTSATLRPDTENEVALSAVQVGGSVEGKLFFESTKIRRGSSKK